MRMLTSTRMAFMTLIFKYSAKVFYYSRTLRQAPRQHRRTKSTLKNELEKKNDFTTACRVYK